MSFTRPDWIKAAKVATHGGLAGSDGAQAQASSHDNRRSTTPAEGLFAASKTDPPPLARSAGYRPAPRDAGTAPIDSVA